MDYLFHLDCYIEQIITEDQEYYRKVWEDELPEEVISYLTLEMSLVDVDEMHLQLFNNNNYNYGSFVDHYREPTAYEYHNILCMLRDENEYGLDISDIIKNHISDTMELFICIRARPLINKFNEEKLENVLEEITIRKKAILTIQRAFREYRYNPKHKYCKLIETEKLLNLNAISEDNFFEYIKENKITILPDEIYFRL